MTFEMNENDPVMRLYSVQQEEIYTHLVDLWKQFIEAYLAKNIERLEEIVLMEEVETDKHTKQEFVNILHRQFQLFAEKGEVEPVVGKMESCSCYGGGKRTFVVGQANSFYQFGFFPEFRRSKKLSIHICSWLSNYRDYVDVNDPFYFKGSVFNKSKNN